MSEWWDLFLGGDYGAITIGPSGVLLSMLVAFVVGQVIGWVYMITHTSLSYSQSFVASIVVIPVIVSLMMVLMSGSLMIAFGLLAVFAVVRFRNVLKDTRDTTYILWTIVEGMAAGTTRHTTALIGVLIISLITLYLWLTSFGTRFRFDAVLTLRLDGDISEGTKRLSDILHRHAYRCRLTSEREIGESGIVYSYRLGLRDPSRSGELEHELLQIPNHHDVSLYMSDGDSEV